jgi:hypothetical protein
VAGDLCRVAACDANCNVMLRRRFCKVGVGEGSCLVSVFDGQWGFILRFMIYTTNTKKNLRRGDCRPDYQASLCVVMPGGADSTIALTCDRLLPSTMTPL